MNKIILSLFLVISLIGTAWANNGWYSTLQGTASDVEQDIPSDGVILQWSSFYQKWLFAYGVAPSGGTTGQVLTKNSGSNYDYSWTTPSGGGSISLPSGQVGYGTGSGITSASTFTYNTTNGITVNRVDINDLTANGSTRALNITSQEPFPVTVTGTVPTEDSQTDLVVGNNLADFIMGARDDGTTFLQASSSTPMLRIEQAGGDLGYLNVNFIDIGETGSLGATGLANIYFDNNGNIQMMGEISSPINAFYINFDSSTVTNIGNTGSSPGIILDGDTQVYNGQKFQVGSWTFNGYDDLNDTAGTIESGYFATSGFNVDYLGNAYFAGNVTVRTNLTLGSGTHNFYYCSAGVSIGQVCRGNGCTCVGGTETAIPTLTL